MFKWKDGVTWGSQFDLKIHKIVAIGRGLKIFWVELFSYSVKEQIYIFPTAVGQKLVDKYIPVIKTMMGRTLTRARTYFGIGGTTTTSNEEPMDIIHYPFYLDFLMD